MSNSVKKYSIFLITISLAVVGCLAIFDFPSSSLIDASYEPSQNNSNTSSSEPMPVGDNSSSDNFSKTNAGELQIRYTGIIRSDIRPEVARALGLNETYPGLIITEVLPDSPAEKAGLRGANQVRAIEGEIVRLGGDIIVAVDGNRSAVEDRQSFIEYLQSEKTFGDNITFTILRDGNIKRANLTITPIPDFFSYVNDDEGIRMKYPSDWDVSDSGLGRGDIIRFFSPEDNADTGEPVASVSVKVIPSEGATLEEFALRERDPGPDLRNLDVKARDLSGQQAYESIFFDYGANATTKGKSVFAVRDDQVYVINFVSEPSRYDDYLPMVEEMMKSFRFDENAE
jgi:hypothetical protein